MASVNIFDTLRQRVEQNQTLPEYERRATYWFASQRDALTQWQKKTATTTFPQLQRNTFTKKLVPPNRPVLGQLYFFLYNPIGRNTLPYYDRFPLVIPIRQYADPDGPGPRTGGFLGLNFHYLDYRRRAVLFDALYDDFLRGGDPEQQPLRTRIAATYQLLNGVSKYKAFRPCVKRYDSRSIQTPLLQVGAQDWDLALFLPVEQFRKESKSFVWHDSVDRIR